MDDLPHILVVDDDRRLRDLLKRYLVENGFRVTAAADAGDARQKMQSLAFDLLVVDVMMPGETGLQLTESLRTRTTVPIMMLTALGESEDRIAGLEHGADDYLVKPFEPRELLLRIQTILRRAPAAGTEREITFGACRYLPATAELFREEERIRLTDSEARLLGALARNPGSTVAREILADELGLNTAGRAVDVQMTRLRRKIELDPRNPRHLQTVRGVGYMLATG
jgi:two-component system phosphate regulon response regulator OmpR